MANQKQFILLHKRHVMDGLWVPWLNHSVKRWNQWRIEHPDVEIDLSGADFKGCSVEFANLENANLENTNFKFVNLRSTNLENANLKNANLENANLNSANLNSANLKFANLRAANLNSANLNSASLENAKLNSAKLYSTNLNSANLENAQLYSAMLYSAKLKSAKLNFAKLNFAKLTSADLENVDLSNAFLRAVTALGTSFKGATLTGACIADWHINSETNFEDVVCDYIYLKWDVEKKEPTERRPSDPNRNFAPGEFTKIYQQVRETVDLFFGESIDWQAFLTSYQNVQCESDHGELDIRAIEKSPDGSFIIRVEVPEDTNKADLESQFYERYEGELKRLEGVYQQQLQAKDREIDSYRRESANMTEIAKLLASRPITVEAKAVAGDSIKQSGNFGIGYMSGGEIQSGAKVVGVLNEAEKQDLQTAAREIQSLLDQLSEEYGNDEDILAAKILKTAKTPSTKLHKLLTSLQSGSIAALDSFLDHPAASFVITFLDTWHQKQLDG